MQLRCASAESEEISSVEPIPNSSDCDYSPWLAWIWLDLLPQPANVNVYGAGVADVIVSPEMFEYLVAGECPASVRHQQRQQSEFAGLHVEWLTLELRRMAREVNLQISPLEYVRGACLSRRLE